MKFDDIYSLGIIRARSEGVEEGSVGSRGVGVGGVLAEDRSNSSIRERWERAAEQMSALIRARSRLVGGEVLLLTGHRELRELLHL